MEVLNITQDERKALENAISILQEIEHRLNKPIFGDVLLKIYDIINTETTDIKVNVIPGLTEETTKEYKEKGGII